MPRLSLPVDDKLNSDLKNAAKEQHRSVISLILSILEEWVANWRKSKKRA